MDNFSIFSSGNDRSSHSNSMHDESKPGRWREMRYPIAAAIVISLFSIQYCHAEPIPRSQIKSFDVTGAYQTVPQDINNSLTIVGQAYGAENTSFIYRNRVRETAPEYRYYRINNKGQILGQELRQTPGEGSVLIGFVKTGDDIVYLNVPGIGYSFPDDINVHGAMVGSSDGHVYIFKDDVLTRFLEDWEDVDPRDEGGIHGAGAYSINDNGVVVGSYTANGGGEHGFIYDGSNNALGYVSDPSGEDTTPRGINNWGLIVGIHHTNDETSQGFAYFDGKYIPVEVGTLSTTVTGVNDWGFITGSYRDSWQEIEHGFVSHILPFIFWDQINSP